jgi:DNA polymerase IV
MNRNSLTINTDPFVLFVDMNSFFASCEQQVNYWLRNRPVAVCVYTGQYGCIISPSVEAKRRGIKLGLRLNEAMKICPDLVPLETNPGRYRSYHKKIIKVLRKYSNEVIPKSIDEAVVNFKNCRLMYKDLVPVARQIKEDIKNEVGDWLQCSIGIAPNAFLAKLASDFRKPDGLQVITKDNIDKVLAHLKLKDLPGISTGMEDRLKAAGIHSPLQLRHSSPQVLQAACKSIIGLHWYYRLNFGEVDLQMKRYKTMGVMRHLSKEQRASRDMIEELLVALCMKLEKRMMQQGVYCRYVQVHTSYTDGARWGCKLNLQQPLQDGVELLHLIRQKTEAAAREHSGQPVLDTDVSGLGITIADFVQAEAVQYELFDNRMQRDHLRRTIYNIKERFGSGSIMNAVEMGENDVLKDAIGFGSVKDLEDDEEFGNSFTGIDG